MLKAAIIHKGGKIREAYEKETIGFGKCVRKCLSDSDVRCLSEDEGLAIQIINSLRDAAQHDVVELSEQDLYLHAQSGLTIFRDVLSRVFCKKLSDFVPDRVLPISPKLPKDLHSMIESDFSVISEGLKKYSRNQVEAKARLKSLVIIEDSLSGVKSQPSELDVNSIARKIREGKGWREIFPGIATLQINTEGEGVDVSIRISRKEGDPVQIVPEGTPGATVLAVKKIDPLSFYSLGLTDLAKKFNLGAPKMLAVVKELDIQGSEEYFKEISVGKVVHKRYSSKALSLIREQMPSLDMDEVWRRHKPQGRKPKR